MEIKDRLHAKAFGKYHFLKCLPDLSEVYTQFWIEENIKSGEKNSWYLQRWHEHYVPVLGFVETCSIFSQ